MKASNITSRTITLVLSIGEVGFFCNAIREALQSLGDKEFLSGMGKTREEAIALEEQLGKEYEKESKKLQANPSYPTDIDKYKITFSREEIVFLVNVIGQALRVTDPIEFHTFVGRTMEESKVIRSQLGKMVEESKKKTK